MIVREHYKTRSDGVELYRTYSDAGYLIRQVETGAEYSEAIDVADAPYTYTETDKPDVSSVEQIPAERGMEYVYGRYYTDPEDGGLYLCGVPGQESIGTITLEYLPHEMAGLYFTLIE